jgi:hypothetical protein
MKLKITLYYITIHWLSTYGEDGNTHILVGKSEGKKALGRRRHRWEENITIYIRETV